MKIRVDGELLRVAFTEGQMVREGALLLLMLCRTDFSVIALIDIILLIAIVGGLLFSQLLTLYTTPVIYLYMDRFRHWLKRQRTRKVPA